VTPGDAWLYAVDLALGFKKYNWGTESDNRNGDDRIKHMGSQFLGKPTLISTPVKDIHGVTKTQGDIIVGKEVIPVGFNLQTMRTSLTIEEEH
jgi:type IV pilus assembly protein PilY1